MKIAVLTVCIGDAYMKSVADGIESKKEYCAKHGYTFLLHQKNNFPKSTAGFAWSKLPALIEHLPSYDWIFMSDADVLITNYEFSLEALIQRRFVKPLSSALK